METCVRCSLKVLISVLIVLNIRVHGQTVKISILENAVGKGAVCLDGSPAGYHYSVGSGDGANNWLVYLPGGGWCGTTDSCLTRLKTQPDIASTANATTSYFDGILSLKQSSNPDFYNWNKVYIRYCDGSSFVGDVEEVDPETNLHYRGSRIFGAVVNELLAKKGLDKAQNVILAGNSAGGLATILNCDRFRALVPNATRLKCLSDSGFFLRAKDLPNADQRESSYAQVVELHGVAKFLPESCTSGMDPSLCFFPENLVGDVQTPLFLLNSDFDRFQISNNLKPYVGDEPGWKNCTNLETCTPSQSRVIRDFRNTFLKTLKEASGDRPSTGMFINSCYIHDYLWATTRWNAAGSPRLENKTIAQVVGDWYFDRSIVKLIDTQTDHPINCNV